MEPAGSSPCAAEPVSPASVETVRVEVVYAPADAPADLSVLELPVGATLAQALRASGVLARHGLSADQLPVGIWGRRVPPQTLLRAGDRVELYRALLCDPKEARRLRDRGQRRSGKPEPGSRRSA